MTAVTLNTNTTSPGRRGLERREQTHACLSVCRTGRRSLADRATLDAVTYFRRIVQLSAAGTLAAALLAPAPAAASSSSVAALQVALRSMGLYHSTIDGVTGPLTRRGVRIFQSRRHLQADGIAGPRTRRALGRRGRPRLGSRAMRAGQTGFDVAALQFLLSKRGFGPGGFDGGFGPRTTTAVLRFQRAAGLAADGVAGPVTLARLRGRRTFTYVPRVHVRPVANYSTHRGGPLPAPGRRAAGRRLRLPGRAPPHGHRLAAALRRARRRRRPRDRHVRRLQHRRLRQPRRGQPPARLGDLVRPPLELRRPSGPGGGRGQHHRPHRLHGPLYRPSPAFRARLYGTPVDPALRLLSAVSASRAGGTHADTTRLVCRANGDAWDTRDSDPAFARTDRCP